MTFCVYLILIDCLSQAKLDIICDAATESYEHPQSLSQLFLLELNFLGAKFFLSTLNRE